MKKGTDYTGVSVVYFCHDGKGNFVMHKRGKNARDEKGLWDIGGGALKFGESVEDRLRKEIKEEYDTEALDYEFLGYREAHRTHKGEKTHWIALEFKVLVDKDKVKNGEPDVFDEIGWFTLDNMPEPQHSELPRFIEQHKDKL